MSAGQSAEHHGCERKSIQRDEELERFQNERCQDQSQKLDLSGMRSHAFDLSGDSEGKYDELLRQIGDAEIVLIGESTHGSHEFAEERCKITERLIEEKVRDRASTEVNQAVLWLIRGRVGMHLIKT